jgi:phage terminase small subunit
MKLDALSKLNSRQRSFLTHYLGNGQDGTKAAIAAGYSEKNAAVSACAILNTESVKAAWIEMGDATSLHANIISEMRDTYSANIASIFEIQEFWSTLVRSNKDENGENIKLEARIRASELLAKNLGMFVDKIEHAGKDGVSLPCITLNFIKSETLITNG